MNISRVYRIEVVSYPTPDGRAFKDQDFEVYWNAIEHYFNPGNDTLEDVPDWLRDIDISDWMQTESTHGYGGYDEPVRRGYGISDDNGSFCMNVPHLYRVNYFSRHAANQIVKGLREWGAEVVIHRSKPIEFESAGRVLAGKEQEGERRGDR